MSFNYGTSNFYFSLNLEDDEKQKTKFIKDIERIVRSSLEYRNYIKFLKTEALINYCSVLNKLPDDIVNSISIEMHHYPFTLYDITEAILDRHLQCGLNFSRISIANEIMDLHYNNQIGLVPLTETAHELAHSNTIELSSKLIFGDYERFISLYQSFLDQNKIQFVRSLQEKSLLNNDYFIEVNKDVFEIDPSIFRSNEDDEEETKILEDGF
jgi:hypothetical protein